MLLKIQDMFVGIVGGVISQGYKVLLSCLNLPFDIYNTA